MSETENLDRVAARQRALRQIGSEIAGRLLHLEGEAQRVGLEEPRVDAFAAARQILSAAFGVTPFVPKQRDPE